MHMCLMKLKIDPAGHHPVRQVLRTPQGVGWGFGEGPGAGGRGHLRVGERGPHLPLPCPSYAYIEFATESSAHAAVELDKSVFRGRVIKVRVPHQSLRGRGGGGSALL